MNHSRTLLATLLLAPPAAILAYHGPRRLAPGFETMSMLLPFAMILAGAFLFMAMRRDFTASVGPDATH